jgi:branched-chain amino acid transport system substrate-binding protein
MRREAGLVALLAAAALAAGCPGGGERPLRIGVIVDCTGIYRSLEDAELSGASLPLIERGARLRGRRAADGITPARVAGRQVELVRGCTETWEFSTLTTELRWLAEREHVDAIVAAANGPEHVILREVAERYPRIAFVAVAHGSREVTLRHPARNLFRFAADHGQGVAGLADHAFRELGWRRVAVVAASWDAGWSGRDAFTAEFCALGGEVAGQVAMGPFFDAEGKDVERVPRDVDGVAVFAPGISGPAGFLRRLARRGGDPARRVVVGPGIADDPALVDAAGAALDGVAGSSNAEPARLRAYLGEFARAFPGVPAGVAAADQVSGYHDAVEAVVRGLEQAEGDPARLSAALARLRVDLLGGSVRLDSNRQAVVSTSIVRIARSGAPGPATLRRITGVDQSIGGLLEPAEAPSDRAPACRRGRSRPPWSG